MNGTAEMSIEMPAERPVSRPTLGRLCFSVLLSLVFLAAALDARTFPPLARYFPLVIALCGTLATLLQLITEVRRYRSYDPTAPQSTAEPLVLDAAPSDEPLGRVLLSAIKIGAFIPAVWLFGAIGGSVIYVVLFLRFEGRWKWWSAAVAAATTCLILIVLEEYLNFYWPLGSVDLETIYLNLTSGQ